MREAEAYVVPGAVGLRIPGDDRDSQAFMEHMRLPFSTVYFDFCGGGFGAFPNTCGDMLGALCSQPPEGGTITVVPIVRKHDAHDPHIPGHGEFSPAGRVTPYISAFVEAYTDVETQDAVVLTLSAAHRVVWAVLQVLDSVNVTTLPATTHNQSARRRMEKAHGKPAHLLYLRGTSGAATKRKGLRRLILTDAAGVAGSWHHVRTGPVFNRNPDKHKWSYKYDCPAVLIWHQPYQRGPRDKKPKPRTRLIQREDP